MKWDTGEEEIAISSMLLSGLVQRSWSLLVVYHLQSFTWQLSRLIEGGG